MHAEQAGILPRKAEAAEQGLKRRDSRMVRKVVAGRAECCERAAESMVEGVARGQHHDAFPLPAQREDFFRVLSGAAPNDPGVFHRDGAQRHKEPYTASASSSRVRTPVSEGNPVPHETMSMCPAASRVLPFVIWNAPV